MHLLVYAKQLDSTARLMQQAAGEMARDYNRRKGRSGAFWEGRYHATMVGSGEYLWECLKYIELNRVRCSVVGHPSERAYVEGIEAQIRSRQQMLVGQEGGAWVLREEYGAVFGLEKRATSSSGGAFLS